jgi:hypothetical protein
MDRGVALEWSTFIVMAHVQPSNTSCGRVDSPSSTMLMTLRVRSDPKGIASRPTPPIAHIQANLLDCICKRVAASSDIERLWPIGTHNRNVLHRVTYMPRGGLTRALPQMPALSDDCTLGGTRHDKKLFPQVLFANAACPTADSRLQWFHLLVNAQLLATQGQLARRTPRKQERDRSQT